ncbi:MAG: ATP-binding protein [Bacilli bacterium]|jgi:AAA+ ATPase superfamily predicted ATPase|nr:ATP-binding protein [Bacilli bacterium]
MVLYGRKEEMRLLEENARADGFRLVTMYGRRRVGKSHLLHYLKENLKIKSLYFQCADSSEQDNAGSFSKELASLFGLPFPDSRSFIDLIRIVFALSKQEKIVLMVDEYPFLKKRIPGLDSLISKAIAEYPDANLTLILAGSYIGEMLETSSSDGALRGRNMTSIFIKPLPYHDVIDFFPHYSPDEKMTLYAIFGGIPYYAAKIDPSLSAEENIIGLFLSTPTDMRDEPGELFKEITKADGAKEVLSAVASGKHSFTDIYGKTSYKSSAALSFTLNQLLTMGYLEHSKIISEKAKELRGYYYYIADGFLSFYFSLLKPNLSSIGLLSPHDFFTTLIRDKLESTFIPKRFEFLAREFLRERNINQENPHLLTGLGEAVYNRPGISRQFDARGVSVDGDVYYECKYTKDPISAKDIAHLEDSLKLCKLPYVSLGFFAKNGFDGQAKAMIKNKGYEAYTLNDIYRVS